MNEDPPLGKRQVPVRIPKRFAEDHLMPTSSNTMSYHQFIDVREEELAVEVNNLNNVISPLLMIARRLEGGTIQPGDAAIALRGLSILINHKSEEIIEAIVSKELQRQEEEQAKEKKEDKDV